MTVRTRPRCGIRAQRRFSSEKSRNFTDHASETRKRTNGAGRRSSRVVNVTMEVSMCLQSRHRDAVISQSRVHAPLNQIRSTRLCVFHEANSRGMALHTPWRGKECATFSRCSGWMRLIPTSMLLSRVYDAGPMIGAPWLGE